MPVVQASRVFKGSVPEAEGVWYDTATWPRWLPGLASVESVSDGWPAPGGRVRWQSGPAGRGRVTELVVGYEPCSGQTVEVQDDSIRGTQAVSFEADDEYLTVTLRLVYELKRRSPLMKVVDLVFIRRVMTRSLQETLSRFGVQLAASRERDVG